jgi:hypothetical protein
VLKYELWRVRQIDVRKHDAKALVEAGVVVPGRRNWYR